VEDVKIGKLVQGSVPNLIDYCETQDPAEFYRLCDRAYSKTMFNVNYPFWTPLDQIRDLDKIRYWKQIYNVCGVSVRATNDWYDGSLKQWLQYAKSKGLKSIKGMEASQNLSSLAAPQPSPRAARGRFKASAIGNAQNLAVRNILSRLGQESFNERDWQKVVDAFEGRCAYCGQEGTVLIDHIVPINKQARGEHRLGNLVPCCKSCNDAKGDKDYRDFLVGHPQRIDAIEQHMQQHGYTPIGDNPHIAQILNAAHQEVADLAERYVKILNAYLDTPPSSQAAEEQHLDS
jgi:HNH endonuclease